MIRVPNANIVILAYTRLYFASSSSRRRSLKLAPLADVLFPREMRTPENRRRGEETARADGGTARTAAAVEIYSYHTERETGENKVFLCAGRKSVYNNQAGGHDINGRNKLCNRWKANNFLTVF